MLPNKKLLFTVGFTLIVIAVIAFSIFNTEEQIDFNSQVKPILNKKCISCHGGVKQQGGFSVLFREEAVAKTQSGKPAIIPGNAADSEFIKRLKSNDPEERMPYKHPALEQQEINILSDWINQGAKWGKHWAYVSLVPTPIPQIEDNWIRNDLDKFILVKLKENKLQHAEDADRATLLRRVSLDLIGTYPSEKLSNRYLSSKNEQQAYELLVDSLLASPKFGERWASMWLDIARYADTKGYESDPNRNIWSYRDWLIKAFNADMPYNKFITDQIAGDLFSNPTDAQYVATSFSRNTPTNDEGGTNNEEFRTSAVLDRVNATWEGLMSTTFSCVQCHSHPYDPFKHEEYYKFMSYFNNTRDEDVPAEYPLFKIFNDSLKNELNNLESWVSAIAGNERAKKVSLFLKTGQPSINSTTADQLINSVIGNNNIALFFKNKSSARLKSVNMEAVNHIILRYNCTKSNGTLSLHSGGPNGPMITSWKVNQTKGNETVEKDIVLQNGTKDVYLKYTNPSVKDPNEFMLYFDWFYFTKQFPGKGRA
ncbi:MAG: DUF1549 domain-containing protein, partial [Pedobacter sp.]